MELICDSYLAGERRMDRMTASVDVMNEHIMSVQLSLALFLIRPVITRDVPPTFQTYPQDSAHHHSQCHLQCEVRTIAPVYNAASGLFEM